MNQQDFIRAFPEFTKTSPVLVKAKLTQAAGRMGGPDNTVWPPFGPAGGQTTLSDIAQSNLAAHYLALSPFGTEMRLVLKDGTTTSPYWDVWQECCDAVSGGFVVAGACYAPIGISPVGGITVGIGTVSVVNGSPTVVFSTVHTLPAGTIFVFYAQAGVLYSLEADMVAVTTGTISAPYGGTTAPASLWGFELP